MMIDDYLRAAVEFEKLQSSATAGPWKVWDGPSFVGGGADLCIGAGEEWLANMDHRDRRCEHVFENHHDDEVCPICTIDAPKITAEQRANADFIAAARSTPLAGMVRELVKECERLTKELEASDFVLEKYARVQDMLKGVGSTLEDRVTDSMKGSQ